MELYKLWQELKVQEQAFTIEKLTLKEPKSSKNPLRELRKSLIHNVGYSAAGILMGIYLMVQFPAISIQVTLAILIAKSLYFNWKMYQRIRAIDQLGKNLNQPIVPTLQSQFSIIRKTLRMIELRSMLFMPIAYLAGLLIGGSGEGVSADELIKDFKFIAEGMGLALLTTPLIYFLLKWMHNKAFGQFIEQCENLLKELERD